VVEQTELPRAEVFQRFDRDGDGTISREEISRIQSSNRAPAGLEAPPAAEHEAFLNIPYASIEGVPPNFLSLDLYAPKGEAPDSGRPVMVMIHGGGWRGGDKQNPAIVGTKMNHFVGHGYVYASINYRLSPQTPGEAGVEHPTHVQDCAKALAWIHDHVAEYGGDPGQIHLMGHSAGGHLAALLATNERFLKAEGKALSILRSNVLLDPAAIDIPGYIELVDGRGMTALYHNAFTKDPDKLIDASPMDHVGENKGIPPTILFYGGERMNLDRFGPAFTDALTQAAVPSRSIDTVDLDHGQINAHIGMVGDPMTELIMRLHAGESAVHFPANLKEEQTPVSQKPAITWKRDYLAGTRDVNGEFMGGTETMRIVAFQESLYAALSYWTDQPGNDPQPGTQILSKSGPGEGWKVAVSFSDSRRVSALESIQLTTDHEGTPLDTPVELLFADAGEITARGNGNLRCFLLSSAGGDWVESIIAEKADRAFIRAFGSHKDPVTGVHSVYAGTGAGEIYRGSYDPESPTSVRWEAMPEYQNPDFDGGAYRRCQGFCVANGKLYASVAPRLLERQDGPNPSWVEVFRWDPEDRAGAGLRGITAVPAPDGNHEVILGSREQEGRILRVDPANGYEVTDELLSHVFLREQLGDFRGGKLVAYNRFVPGLHPTSQIPIHWVTVVGRQAYQPNSAWLMIRKRDGSYEVVEVSDPNDQASIPLISTRTLTFAPWDANELYVGGYDGAANNRQNHNTAWIYRGTLLEDG